MTCIDLTLVLVLVLALALRPLLRLLLLAAPNLGLVVQLLVLMLLRGLIARLLMAILWFHLVDGDKSATELVLTNLTILRMLALNVFHEASSCLELLIACYTFVDWRHIINMTTIFVLVNLLLRLCTSLAAIRHRGLVLRGNKASAI